MIFLATHSDLPAPSPVIPAKAGNHPRRAFLLFALVAAVELFRAAPLFAEEKRDVFVSILPQASLVERIGGEFVRVRVMVPPGQSPATYEPTPRQMENLADAQAYFSIGVPFEERFLHRAKDFAPGLPVIDSRKGIELLEMGAGFSHHDEHEGHDHEHEHDHEGHDHEHAEGDLDPHVWLDPLRLKSVAANLRDTLIELDPARETSFRQNFETLESELDVLHAKLEKKLAPFEGKTFYVYHPAYGYFADRYGLQQAPVEREGKEPTTRQIPELIDRARRDEAKVIFVQPQFSSTAARTLAKEIGAKVIELDPLPRDPLANLEEMANKIANAFSKDD